MPEHDRWGPWQLTYSTRDGYPVLTETALWQLTAQHPEALERAGDELYVYLDQPYLVLRLPDRAFRTLVPAPDRRRAGT